MTAADSIESRIARFQIEHPSDGEDFTYIDFLVMIDNEPQVSSFVERKESASRAPGPHTDITRALNRSR